MKIALVQSELIWENAQDNRINFEEKISAIAKDTELIILPEMFTTGFSMFPENIAEGMSGETVSWMQKIASERNCAITGSIVIKEDKKYFNRLLFVYPDTKVEIYDKKHLFTLAGEHHKYTAGTKNLIVNYKDFRISFFICYDLRFPVFARNTQKYDLLVYVANWPKPRIAAWDALLKARAIENMSYTIGVNRVGTDANNHEYVGHSQAIDYLGQYVLEPQQTDGVFSLEINKEEQNQVRDKFGFLNDIDDFEIK
jgi:predicted amidohydrolase